MAWYLLAFAGGCFMGVLGLFTFLTIQDRKDWKE
jgi:hypothetical protein